MNGNHALDLDDLLQDIKVPDLSSALADFKTARAKVKEEDIFAEQKRKGWDKTVEARCDFTPRPRLTRRSGLFFLSYWQKSIYGRTLTEIKADDSIVRLGGHWPGIVSGRLVHHHHAQKTTSGEELRHTYRRGNCPTAGHPVLRGCVYLQKQATSERDIRRSHRAEGTKRHLL